MYSYILSSIKTEKNDRELIKVSQNPMKKSVTFKFTNNIHKTFEKCS